MECFACCVARAFKMKPLRIWIKEHFDTTEMMRDVIYGQSEDGGELFCFDYGVLIFWSFSKQRRQELMHYLRSIAVDPREEAVEEVLTFHIGERFQIQQDEFILGDAEWKTKLALSHAFAQSVKLESFEECVEQMMARSQRIVSNLAESGTIKMTRREIAKQLGRLIQEKSSVQLYCDVLDTPDFFWESSELQPIYDETMAYLDLEDRLQVLHRRLDTIRDTFEILSGELNHLHSAFLEWIIIALILIEVVFSFIHFMGLGGS